MPRPSKRALDKLRSITNEHERPAVEVRHVTLTFPDRGDTPNLAFTVRKGLSPTRDSSAGPSGSSLSRPEF